MFQIKVKEEKAAKLVKLGRSKFVLFYGVLGWGVPVALLFAADPRIRVK